jgi:hypothetical protein
MKSVARILCILCASMPAAAASAEDVREVRFTGDSAVSQLCACLLAARALAEAQGRLDFNAEVTFAGGGRTDVTARIWPGSAHALGRITFTGHAKVNDSTLRDALLVNERELFDVGRMRRSLARLNHTGFFEPLSLADLVVQRRDDGVTADVTIPLRERKRRWWSLSGPIVPGLGSFQASLASRLPPWGRGVLDASTFVVRLNLLGFFTPAAAAIPLVLERPVLPGQEWLSGFALSPASTPTAMLAHYGRAQLGRGVQGLLDYDQPDRLVLPVVSGSTDGAPLVCDPPKPRLWWLRRAGTIATEMVLNGFMP